MPARKYSVEQIVASDGASASPRLFGDVWTLRLPIETTNLAPDLLSAQAVKEAYRSTASAAATPPSPKGYIQNYWSPA